VREPAGEPLGEFPHPVGIVQRVARGGGAIPVVAVTHQDRDAVVVDRIKGVLVGDVVAEVDRQQRAGSFVVADAIEQSLSLTLRN